MTLEGLQACTRKKLASLAKTRGILGWHAMRKEELVKALAAAAAPAKRSPSRPAARAASTVHNPPERVARSVSSSKPAPARASKARQTVAADGTAVVGDSLDVVAVSRNWLQVRWNIARASLNRAGIALGPDWHLSRLTLRLVDVTTDETAVGSNRVVQEVTIPGQEQVWFLNTAQSDRTHRVQLGYRTPQGKFFLVLRSRLIRPGEFQETRSVGRATPNRVGPAWDDVPAPRVDDLTPSQLASLAAYHCRENGSRDLGATNPFQLAMTAELVVQGSTHPLAGLTLMGKPANVDSDGQFFLRLPLPPGRQVIPAVAVDPHGGEERTVVLAIDLSAKELEPRSYDDNLAN